MKKETKNADCPAFGHVAMTDSNGFQEPGLTKREYFAAMAMQGLLGNPEWMELYEGKKYLLPDYIMTKIAVERADALLAELEKPQP